MIVSEELPLGNILGNICFFKNWKSDLVSLGRLAAKIASKAILLL